MSDSSGGAFNKQVVPRVKSLSQARDRSLSESPFQVRPGGSGFSVFEARKTHIAPTMGTSWLQQFATPSVKMSTKYEKLADVTGISDITRANKALVRGGSDSLSPTRGINVWRDKQYSDSGALTASLLRINETTTAFGPESMGSPTHDAGTGIMSELLAQKWEARSAGTGIDTKSTFESLTGKYRQLESVDKMQTQGKRGLVDQITSSRMRAAVAAGQRGYDKGFSDLSEYAQRKFNKHGLGQLPKGWSKGVVRHRD